MVSKLSDADKLECVKLYNDGKSCKEIAQMYNVSTQAIWGILNRRNVKMRTQHEVQQKYTCDEHFFDVIDCESKNYFLDCYMQMDAILTVEIISLYHYKNKINIYLML